MEVCGSTNSVMTEMGGGASRTMKVGEDARNLIISAVIDMKRVKLMHKMKEICGAINHMMDQLIMVKHQVARL